MLNSNTNILEQKGILLNVPEWTYTEKVILNVLHQLKTQGVIAISKTRLCVILYGPQHVKRKTHSADFNAMRQQLFKINKKMVKKGLGTIAYTTEEGYIVRGGSHVKLICESRFWDE